MDDHQGDRNAAAFWVLALCTYLIMPGAYAQNANSPGPSMAANAPRVIISAIIAFNKYFPETAP